MYSLPTLLLLATTALAIPTPQISQTKPNLPDCPSLAFAPTSLYGQASHLACRDLFIHHANKPNPQPTDTWKLSKGTFVSTQTVKTWDGKSKTYSFNVEQKNGDWKGFDLTLEQCQQAFYDPTKVLANTDKSVSNQMCTVKADTAGGWIVLAQGWSSEMKQKNFATADFWIAVS